MLCSEFPERDPTYSHWPQEVYVPTVFENYTVPDVEVDGEIYDVHIWDNAGTEEYDRLRPLSYPDSDVVLICFSIDNRNSLENVEDKASAGSSSRAGSTMKRFAVDL